MYFGHDLSSVVALAVLFGTALVVASGCVVNNYFDRKIDAQMCRTKKRALVTGAIVPGPAVLFSAVLLCIGLLVLTVFTNQLTVLLGIIAWLTYSLIYTVAKHHTVHSTLIGTIPGAIPPVAGYAATSATLDVNALLLFLIWFFWQLAHFYAIAIKRFADYAAASVPVSSVAYGIVRTKKLIVASAFGFLMSCLALYFYGNASVVFMIIMALLGTRWLHDTMKGLHLVNQTDTEKWAGAIFGQSLSILLTLMALLASNTLLQF